MFGYTRQGLLQQNLRLIIPSIGAGVGDDQVIFSQSDTLKYPHGRRWELFGLKKSGIEFPIELSVGFLDLGNDQVCTASISDLTDHKLTRAQLEASLEEKEILLREIHHRVKNNLQVISSIFSLQRRRTSDETVSAILQESQGRVQSIALLHESLYRSRDLSKIDMNSYFRDLLKYHLQGLSSANRIVAKVEAEGVFLGLDNAIPCALIVNELLTNSIRHGYPPNFKTDEKWIKVSMYRLDDNSIHLIVSDNGIGVPKSITSARAGPSLGLNLVDILCTQLGGTSRIESTEGSTFHFIFPDLGGYNDKTETINTSR